MPVNEQPIAHAADLKDGEMKEVSVGENKILLARLNGSFYATNGACPHYGASLAKGVLCGDRVICPWHKACFRVTDGALLEPPALDSLPSYPVRVHDGQVLIDLPKPDSSGGTQPMGESAGKSGKIQSQKERHIVIAGAGAAGLAAAESLRAEDFTGKVTMISYEEELPYDRTKLSKEYLSGNAQADKLPLRPKGFYDDYSIDRLVGEITDVNISERRITLADGGPLSYDGLLIASGSTPEQIDIPGSDLGNVFVLRSQADADRILAAITSRTRVVLVGGSFIALEAASCFALRKNPVTVVLREEVPFAKKFGEEVGRSFQHLHESKGVEFRVSSKVARFDGAGTVRQVVLQSGDVLPADLVVIGTGVRPATDFIHGLQMQKDGGIVVDKNLRAAPDVYAAGDVAAFPDIYSNQLLRIEHWRVAEQHGRLAGANLAGRSHAFEGVPYFWSNHFGNRFDYVGHAEKWDDIIIDGDTNKPEFIAYYVQGDRIAAAAAWHRDTDIDALHELIRLNRVPSPGTIRQESIDLVAAL